MANNQFRLLGQRRLLPLFITQFLGAFHDNLFRYALVTLLVFSNLMPTSADPKMLATLAAGIFILPFMLFSTIGGQLADRFPKEQIMRSIKLVEIGIAAIGTVALMSGSVTWSFITLFLLGAHSAFFGPSKYSILPQHLERHDLIGGNALLNTGTFLAILLGTIAGTSLVLLPVGREMVCAVMFASAFIGYGASRFIPSAPPAADARVGINPLREFGHTIAYSLTRSREVTLCLFGLAWFYFMGSVFMAQLPNFVKESLGADQHVLTILLVLFSVGVAFGGLLNNRLLRGRVEGYFVPLAVLGMSIFSVDLVWASADTPASLPIRVAFDIAAIAVCGGLFAVPLSVMLQDRTNHSHRARVMAASAVINAGFMVLSSVVSALLLAKGFSVRDLFFTFALVNVFAALLLCRLIPIGGIAQAQKTFAKYVRGLKK